MTEPAASLPANTGHPVIHRRPRRAMLPLMLYGFTVLVLFFLVAPIFVVFPLSLSSGELLVLPTPGYSLRWYEDFFTNDRWLNATYNSFVVGIATMIVATTLGTLAALGIFLGKFRSSAFLLAIMSLPTSPTPPPSPQTVGNRSNR